MNYRHAFHAGNHCDVLKHAALVLVLSRLAVKDKAFAVLDVHGGRGLYDLHSDEARRSPEFEGGIGRIFGAEDAPAPLQAYLAAVARQNPFGGHRWYPGSPLLIQGALRVGDSAKFTELHPEERAALEAALGSDRRIKIFERDAYEAVRAFLPPKERRGLVLIDPPFEKPGEYDRLAAALADGMERFSNGVFMIWRPVKDEDGWRQFLQKAEALDVAKTLVAELTVSARRPDKLTGSGLFIVNPPFGLSAALMEILPYLSARLAVAPGGGWLLTEREGSNVLADAKGAA
ncbi:MAG: 23S rRNA (adenine(2030)-N(6))-methyltransferase RlmJ [Parvularculaceae bacterium]